MMSYLKFFDAPELPRKPTWEITLKIIFYIAAIVIDLVGNSIVILIIYRNKKIRTSTNILIFNLAISDLMVACFCMWVHLGNQLSASWPFGGFMCKMVTFVQVFSVILSVLCLTCISIERFLTIVFPVKGKLSHRGIYLLIILSWLTAIAVASPQLFVREIVIIEFKNRKDIICQEKWPKYYIDEACTTSEPGRRVYYTVEAVIMYLIPILVMLIAYSIVLAKLSLRKISGNLSSGLAASHDKVRRKVLRMLIVVVVAFIVCWTPQQTFLLWDVYRTNNSTIPTYVMSLKYAAVYLAYFNSALNPLIYAGLNENFRKGFKDAFKCKLMKRKTQVQPVTIAVQTPLTMNAFTLTPST